MICSAAPSRDLVPIASPFRKKSSRKFPFPSSAPVYTVYTQPQNNSVAALLRSTPCTRTVSGICFRTSMAFAFFASLGYRYSLRASLLPPLYNPPMGSFLDTALSVADNHHIEPGPCHYSIILYIAITVSISIVYES
jgi:hypothetical protein